MPHQKRSIGLMEWVHQSNNPRLRLSNDFRQKTRRTRKKHRASRSAGRHYSIIPFFYSFLLPFRTALAFLTIPESFVRLIGLFLNRLLNPSLDISTRSASFGATFFSLGANAPICVDF